MNLKPVTHEKVEPSYSEALQLLRVMQSLQLVTNPMYNMKSYVPFSQFVSGYNEGCMQDKIVLRYADVLLMNAEASNELGNTTQALASLELVRARARQGNNAILPKVTTTDQTALRTAIYHERRVELAMEFDRYFDVIRQGRAARYLALKDGRPIRMKYGQFHKMKST